MRRREFLAALGMAVAAAGGIVRAGRAMPKPRPEWPMTAEVQEFYRGRWITRAILPVRDDGNGIYTTAAPMPDLAMACRIVMRPPTALHRPRFLFSTSTCWSCEVP